MECIIEPITWFLEYFPEINEDEEFVLSKYIVTKEIDDKILLYHTMSWGLYIMSKEEYAKILTSRYFKQLRAVVNKSVDERPIAEKVYYRRSVTDTPNTYDFINSFVIFTTTACNARCPYCYEKGTAFITMKEETALDCVDFMIEKSKGHKIHINWFGGEPLMNTKVIDLICNTLIDRGAEYTSSIISNGLLFNEEMVKKAKSLWLLEWAQITIDGEHDTYNATKNYQNPQCDPFEKVVENIKLLVKEDIHVKIRINLNDSNIDTFDDNVASIKERFEDEIHQGKISVNPALIYGSFLDGYNEEFNDKLSAVYDKYPDIIRTNREKRVIKPITLMHCMADIGTGIAINPQGYIEPCEHWRDDLVMGHIKSGITNEDVIKFWQNKEGNLDFCKEWDCPLIPCCEHMNNCPGTPGCLTESYWKQVLIEMDRMMERTYRHYLADKEAEEEENNNREE